MILFLEADKNVLAYSTEKNPPRVTFYFNDQTEVKVTFDDAFDAAIVEGDAPQKNILTIWARDILRKSST